MKEWMESVTSWMLNKKRTIGGIAVTGLMLAGIGGTAIAAEGMKTATVAKIGATVSVGAGKEEQTEKISAEKEEKKEEKKAEEKKEEKEKKEADGTVSVATAAETVKEKAESTASQKQTAGSGAASTGTSANTTVSTGTASGSGSSSQGTSGNSAASNSGSGSRSTSSGNTQVSQPVQPSQPAEPAQPAQPAEPAQPSQPVHEHNWQPQYTTEQKWVVDQAAWTETVSEPVYGMVEKSICNTCNEDITGSTTAHGKATRHDGYHSEWVQVQTGTNTYEISHPEEGHYEYYDVLIGYVCSCGATK